MISYLYMYTNIQRGIA